MNTSTGQAQVLNVGGALGSGSPQRGAMEITFIGHAGFCVETPRAIVVMDPWLSPSGAFDSAWFQFPRNHHLAAFVQEKLTDSRKERFLYISHEHKDHLDPTFLSSLQCRDFTVVIPNFRRQYLQDFFAKYRCKEVVVCSDGDECTIPDGYLKLYLDDAELNRDSAVLVRSGDTTFLNLNDCRIHDALPLIARAEGSIDVFTCQFSGAGWHPTCYSYPQETYEAISTKKATAKFRNVAEAIKTVQPRIFFPSAGPPCFLDPKLIHLNFEKINIFPRSTQLLEFLDRRIKDFSTTWMELMPGDVLDAASGQVVHHTKQRVTEEKYEEAVRAYVDCYERFFAERECQVHGTEHSSYVAERLREVLQEKVEALTLHSRVTTPLYFCLEDLGKDGVLRVDFPKREVEFSKGIDDKEHYLIVASSWDIARVLDGKINWDDFSLSFRLRLNREPDLYQTLLQGFLRLETEDMNWFCAKLLDIENRQERIVIEADDKRYVIDRYCPHQGGDLSRAWIEEDRFLICPRHHWQFDLENGGTARKNDGTIHAFCLDND